MPRLTSPEQVLFLVAVRPVYAGVGGPGNRAFKRIAGKKAIVNKRDHSVVGVAGSGYRLVTNAEAIDAARTRCVLAFPESGSGDAPESGSYCQFAIAGTQTSHAVMNGESLHVAGCLPGHRRAGTTNRYVRLDDVTLSHDAGRPAPAIGSKLRATPERGATARAVRTTPPVPELPEFPE